SLSAGTGSVSSSSGSGTTTVTVNLTGVTNPQRARVTVFGVNTGTRLGDVVVPIGVLVGDTNANGAVSASDIGQTKGQAGQPVTASNFREDVNANGAITASDIGLVKLQSGTSLPPVANP
ncbi:MAG: dockerin type I domain-containing protein, partial [Chthoniobacterales bacterium]